MKHIKNFETLNDALGQKVENPSVSKIGDTIYYSKQQGIITSISNNTLNIGDEIEYWKSQPLTITNIGDSDGKLEIYYYLDLDLSDASRKSWKYLYYKYKDNDSEPPVRISGMYYGNSCNVEIPAKQSIILYTSESDNDWGSSVRKDDTCCNYVQFSLEGSTFSASGNLCSLLSSDFINYNPDSGWGGNFGGQFNRLFSWCVNLVDIANLYCPVTDSNYLYDYTFGNSGVKSLPLFDIKVPNYCEGIFRNTFTNCLNLIDLSEYSIECGVFGNNSCNSMFANCYHLEKSPIIKNVQNYKYRICADMFANCTNLKQVTYVGNMYSPESGSFSNWLYNVSPTGAFYTTSETKDMITNNLGCGSFTYPCGWEVKTI